MEDSHQHYIGKVAQKAVIEKDGKILVCHGVGEKAWEFPGGRLHIGETPQEGLQREVREEVGINVEVGQPILLWRSFHKRDQEWLVMVGYRCTLSSDSEAVVDGTEIDEARWVTRDELAEFPLLEYCRPLASAFCARI